MSEIVKGFKVFNGDWTCSGKQYTCPGMFEEEGELEICKHGMHFFENVADCFDYYAFDGNNKVAEIIAHGKVIKRGNKSCTDKLEIVREISWHEVLCLANMGENCTGLGNIGSFNAGDHNTGGRNVGDCNAGNWNTGSFNSGDWNTGSRNDGNFNVGNCNVGNWNTGSFNSGDWNTGSWNKSSYSTGCFNTEQHKIFMFDRPSDWTYADWMGSEALEILEHMPKNRVDWIWEEDMTDKEKENNPSYKTTHGYFKLLDVDEAAQRWWDGLDEKEKEIIKSLPNFEPDIFKQCTGIKVDEELISL